MKLRFSALVVQLVKAMLLLFACCQSGAQVNVTNLPPSVRIVFPTDGVFIAYGGTTQLRAVASDPDGFVTEVQFFVDGILVATNTSAPYTNFWPGILGGAGSHVLTATAIDNSGAVATSEPVVVFRSQAPGHNAYGIIAPTDGSVFVEPATFEVQAILGLSDGRFRQTDFYMSNSRYDLGTNRIAQLDYPPYTVTVSNLMAGTYTFFVVANTNVVYQQPVNAVPVTVTVVKLETVEAGWNSSALFEFHELTAFPGKPNWIQASTNLVDWMSISTNVPAATKFRFIDVDSVNYSRRFYRVVVLP